MYLKLWIWRKRRISAVVFSIMGVPRSRCEVKHLCLNSVYKFFSSLRWSIPRLPLRCQSIPRCSIRCWSIPSLPIPWRSESFWTSASSLMSLWIKLWTKKKSSSLSYSKLSRSFGWSKGLWISSSSRRLSGNSVPSSLCAMNALSSSEVWNSEGSIFDSS